MQINNHFVTATPNEYEVNNRWVDWLIDQLLSYVKWADQVYQWEHLDHICNVYKMSYNDNLKWKLSVYTSDKLIVDVFTFHVVYIKKIILV
jgi:hypothetical protein